MSAKERGVEVAAAVEARDLEGGLTWLAAEFGPGVRFSSSMGKEDQVVAHAIRRAGLDIEVFTLDTGRLFEETHELIAEVRRAYGRGPTVYLPDAGDVEALVNGCGPYGFRRSVSARKECCRIRKVEPLRRALAGATVWITGLRAAQSEHRRTLTAAAWDSDLAVIKVNPLVHWTDADVDAYVATHHVPVNALHARGFASIGCAPCTRAIEPGEDARAGRWWWEASGKECGLHR
jgi:phosphoadenosine phosphosulfate reductase